MWAKKMGNHDIFKAVTQELVERNGEQKGDPTLANLERPGCRTVTLRFPQSLGPGRQRVPPTTARGLCVVDMTGRITYAINSLSPASPKPQKYFFQIRNISRS